MKQEDTKKHLLDKLPIGDVSPRFIVDERNGCIGIRDTKHPDFNKSNGLNQDMPDVVAFEMGTRIDTGKFIMWYLEPKVIKSFNNRCSILNEG